MVQFKSGLAKAKFYLKYLLGIRWLFHGQFSGQDHWMVEQTDAPPERLYRPDVSLIEWRRLFDGRHAITGEPTAGPGHPSGATATASTNGGNNPDEPDRKSTRLNSSQ